MSASAKPLHKKTPSPRRSIRWRSAVSICGKFLRQECFFASAYDLFIIGTALTLIKGEWHLSPGSVALIGSISLAATFVGAFVFGRAADIFGRKSIHGLEALLMTIGALSLCVRTQCRHTADRVCRARIRYRWRLSAVLISEYSNTKSRGRMVSLVFSTQAVGLVVGPAIALTLLAAGINHDIAWRIMLGLGALPAAMVIYIRRTLPESPRWLARVKATVRVPRASLPPSAWEPRPPRGATRW
ncbi:MAG: MFS transporter [Acidiphilium sp.]